MNKIIAKQVSPEYADFSYYFDDDGMRGEYAFYIPETRDSKGFNSEEYQSIVRQIEELEEGFADIANNNKYYYSSYKEAMSFSGLKYNSTMCGKLKKLFNNNFDSDSLDDVAEFLEITTGEKWNTAYENGYCQGDFVEALYPEKYYSAESMKEILSFWLGCGSEFIIDDCGGYYVTDSIVWNEKELKNYLSEMYGCKPEEMTILLYDGEASESIYRAI